MAYGFYDNKSKADIENVANIAASNKVDKVSGKVLSTNNYSATDKSIVTEIPTILNNKVTKVTGKGLSTNSLTNAYLEKLLVGSYSMFQTNYLLSAGGGNDYSASDPFVCPYDGYVQLIVPDTYSGGTPQAVLYVQFGNSWESKKLVYNSVGCSAVVFLKKGMKIYATTTLSNSAVVMFYPMTLVGPTA